MAHARLIITLSLIVAAIVFAALSFSSCRNRSSGGNGNGGSEGKDGGPKTERVVIGGRTFDLEVAADPASRELGLMNRTSIADTGGMIFIFPDQGVQVQGFWMKNCLVDIDILYLDPRGKITAMHRMRAETPKRADEAQTAYEARLKRYSSGYPAQFAIELKAGWLDQLNLRIEDQIPLDLDRLKGLAR